MLPLKIFAVDDEELALRRLELLVSRIDGAELIGRARGATEALDKLSELRPDVLLVDVQMAGLSGFDLVDSLPDPVAPRIIFATAFARYAADAFDVSAVDFLVKPIELSRLARSLDKARRSIAAEDADLQIAELRQIVATLREQAYSEPRRRYEKEIWAERQGEFYPVSVCDIERVEAERDYVHLHTSASSFILRETVSNMVERLDPQEFIRVRRSTLVKRAAMRTVRKAGYGDLRLQLATGQEVRVGTTYIKLVRAMVFNKYPTSGSR
jgi:DNA-binding LytR/AlgR family response regulator